MDTNETKNGVITTNEGNQDKQEKKPSIIIRAGRAIVTGYRKFKRTKGGKVVTTVVKGGALVLAGYELCEAKHRKDANNVVMVTGGEVETPEEEIPVEETNQPEEPGNEEVEEA